MDTWNPVQYERFKKERSQPFHDLLSLVERRPGFRAIDLGCGTGELTAFLHEALAADETIGVDSSAAMLAKAEAFKACPGLSFQDRDLRELGDLGPFDLIYSNAALQWVDDHPILLADLARRLKPGGQIAVQVPANHDHPSHLVAQRVAGEPRFLAALKGYVRQSPVLPAEDYAKILNGLGFARLTARTQVYLHMLPAAADVGEWVRGTLLTDYERRLGPEDFSEFLARYRECLLAELGNTRPYAYPFKRTFFWGALND